MCGRYATTRTEADLSDLFDAVAVAQGPGPSWNVAPTDPVPLVRISQRRAGRVLDVARWGLVPPWATDMRAGARMINARAETVSTSPAFAPAFARRRCLVPADGWYEWVRDGRSRQAYYMTPGDGSVLAFAGLWSVWPGFSAAGEAEPVWHGSSAAGEARSAGGPRPVLTCSVLTTAALGNLARVHDRMPLILPRERWAGWLAGGGDPGDLLRPMSSRDLAAIEVRAVRPDVGNVRNNGPHLLEPPEPPVEATLF